MANLRDRTARQSENDKRFAVQSFAKDLLDVADNLERAMAALPPDVAAAAESGTAPGEGAPMQAVVLHQLAVGVSLTSKALAKALSFCQKHIPFRGCECHNYFFNRIKPRIHLSSFEIIPHFTRRICA